MVPKHGASNSLPELVDQEAINPAEQRVQDVVRLARTRSGGIEAPIDVTDVHAVRHAVIGAFAEEVRSGSLDEVPGIDRMLGLPEGQARPVSECAHAYAGWVRDPVVMAALVERFGPGYVWSASQLEQYAVRPFDFFVRRILHINDRSQAEEETGPLASGNIVHAVLESLHGRLLESGAEKFTGIAGHLDEACDEVFHRVEQDADLWLGLPSLWRVKREHIHDMLREFVDWDVEALRKRHARPIAVEHHFGSDETARLKIEGLDVAGEAAELLLSGRIDRVDRTEAGDLRIVDYKLNSPPAPGRLKDGALLQSALYMRAWERVSGREVKEALFLSVRHPGRGSRSALSAARSDEVLRFALSIPTRVRAGLFEPVQARSVANISLWQVGIDATRTDRVLQRGNRFEQLDDESEHV